MATREAMIPVDPQLAAAYNAAPPRAKQRVQAAMRELLQPKLRPGRAKFSANGVAHFSDRESKLLLAINRGLDARQQQRSAALLDKMEFASLTDEEHAELMQLTQAAEKLVLKRLKALTELAQLRAVSLAQLLKQLGVEPHLYAK